MKDFPEELLKAVLVKRINRFVAEVLLNNIKLHVYVPNTGRLSELALPGADILLAPINANYKFKILYIINRSFPVMIDSTYSNRLFNQLLKEKKVPDLDLYSTIKKEPVFGNHRFDFMLSSESNYSYIELKSCTLFHNTTGSFPDAVSSRASEHVKALAESAIGKLIFLVLKSDIDRFLPNYHTDFMFYETLNNYKNQIDIMALSVQYDDALKIQSLKKIPVIIPEVIPSGIFLILFFNPQIIINAESERLEDGYYIYTGSDSANVFKTVKLIKGTNGIRMILPDSKFSRMKIISDIPVIGSAVTAEEVTAELEDHGGKPVYYTKQSNFNAAENLIYFKKNPADESWFWEYILQLRFGKYS